MKKDPNEYELWGTYAAIYNLQISHEDTVNENHGWYRFHWRPIWRQTYSLYYSNSRCVKMYWRNDVSNGWNRSFKVANLCIWKFHFWIAWDFLVHKDGPSDMGFKKPLVLP